MDNSLLLLYFMLVFMMVASISVIAKQLVRYVEPETFLRLLAKEPGAIVFCYEGPIYRLFYVNSYVTVVKGMKIYTRSPIPLILPDDCEKIPTRLVGIARWVHGSPNAS